MIANPLEWLLETVLSRAFAQAMAVVIGLYIVLIGFLALQAGQTIRTHEDHLSHKIVKIERVASADAATPEPAAQPVTEAAIEPVPAVPAKPAGAPGDVLIQESAAPAPSLPLPEAPIAGLFEKSGDGLLPVRNPEGLTPFDAYKKPFPAAGKPALAILVTDFGLSDSLSRKLSAELPGEVSFALSPYADNPEEWQKLARSQGHEIWLTVPMETRNFARNDPGPRALLSLGMLTDNQNNLVWAMTRASGYAGLVMDLDDTFKNALPVFQSLLKFSLSRGLGYLDLNPAAPGFAKDYVTDLGAPYGKALLRAEKLDENMLALAADRAKTNHFAILALEPNPALIAPLQNAISSLRRSNIVLAPVSAALTASRAAVAPEAAHAAEPIAEEAPHVAAPSSPHHE